MTYYEKLVKEAGAAMRRHPRSTIALDAETLRVIGCSSDMGKVASKAEEAAAQGKATVILQKPCNPQTWIF